MAKSMQAILEEDVTNLGRQGDVVKVAPGFFRNYLLPRGMASRATASAIKELEFKAKKIEAIRAQKKSEAEELATRLKDVELTVRHRCGEKGTLFGSVTTSNIADALLEVEKFEVNRRQIVLRDPIKSIGEHVATIRIYPEVSADIKIVVKPEADQEKEVYAYLERMEAERKAAEEAARKSAEAAAKRAEEEAAAAEAGETTEGEEGTVEAAPAEEAPEAAAEATEEEEKSE